MDRHKVFTPVPPVPHPTQANRLEDADDAVRPACVDSDGRLRSFLLVLAGPAVRTIEALAADVSPFYGCFDGQHRLQPFDYRHADEMTPFQDSGQIGAKSRSSALQYQVVPAVDAQWS